MRIVHVITGLGVGGAELQLRAVLQHSRHYSEVITLYNPGAVAEMMASDGVKVHDLGMTSNTQLSVLPRLRDLIQAGGYDVVHVHLYRSCIYGRIAARLAATPVVVTSEHSIGETHLERRRMTSGVRALYLGTEVFSDATIAVSETVARRLTKWGVRAGKIEVIPNGCDFSRVGFDAALRDAFRAEFGLPAGAYVVGVLGRLDPNKRFDLVIRAAAPLLGGQARLLIVGGGAIRADLEAEAARQGVAEFVTFAGERHDVAAALSAMDLFVASSEQETFGLSVLEALSNGAPALYTTCPALDGMSSDRFRQVVGEERAMRDAIGAELAIGRRPREDVPAIAERYGMAAVTDRIDTLYERLAARRGQRGGRSVLPGVGTPKPGVD